MKNSPLYMRVATLLHEARARAMQSVNTAMLSAYWHIGREIVEAEQSGKRRAQYGKKVLENLAESFTSEFGSGFDVSNLWKIRKFYLTFPILDALRPELSWTHYRIIMRVSDNRARSFYENECAANRWSARELERQKSSLLFERLALSKDKNGLKRLAKKGQEIQRTIDLIKDPYILEFTGISPSIKLYEKPLEQALCDNLSRFLLELGKGFSYVGRQKRLTLDGDHFFIDLVFYNTILRCYVLIDLKVGKLTHQDIGQIQMYVNYYDRELKQKDDNPTIGLLLCESKKEAIVRYTLPKSNKRIFASKYKLYLPSEEELRKELSEESARLNLRTTQSED